MSRAGEQQAVPCVEARLEAAHRDLALLRSRQQALVRVGLEADHLPDDLTLMAFALLGEHGRAELLGQLESQWNDLQTKGLVHGAIEQAPTALLRLVAHALPLTAAIDDILHRLENALDVPEPPHGVLRCATRVRGLWGQRARLHFSARDVHYALISPDPVFGLQPALIAAEPAGWCSGTIDFPIDKGAIAISLLQRSGELFRHVVHSAVEGAAE